MIKRILVDADACPVKEIIVAHARKRNLPVIMYIDVNHQINDGYSEVVIVDQGTDSADFKLISCIREGDAVITQDYGVAAIALAKNACVIHQSGMLFTKYNIDTLLDDRYNSQKSRRMRKRTQGPKKRTKQDDEIFEAALLRLLDSEPIFGEVRID